MEQQAAITLKKTANWKPGIDLKGKCGACRYYEPLILKGTRTARGHCLLRNRTYRQRTDTCLRFEEEQNEYKGS